MDVLHRAKRYVVLPLALVLVLAAFNLSYANGGRIFGDKVLFEFNTRDRETIFRGISNQDIYKIFQYIKVNAQKGELTEIQLHEVEDRFPGLNVVVLRGHQEVYRTINASLIGVDEPLKPSAYDEVYVGKTIIHMVGVGDVGGLYETRLIGLWSRMTNTGTFTSIKSTPFNRPIPLRVTHGLPGGSEIYATYSDWGKMGQYSEVTVWFRFTATGDIIEK